MVAEVSLFDRLSKLIFDNLPPQEILDLRASEAESQRYRELSLKFQSDIISQEERSELSKFETVEHLMRLAKIKAFKALNKEFPS